MTPQIETIAQEIREQADVFLLIGVGGSNQGARAVIKALQHEGRPEIIYTGNNLSPVYMQKILAQIKGKSVYANVIAKNFATLEPGICFRMIRQYLVATYGEAEAAKRIIATGSPNNSSL
jgi:glucose-6-phosphate isomerase